MANSMDTDNPCTSSDSPRVPPGRHQGASKWSLSALLGFDRCCAPASAAVFAQQLNGGTPSSTPADGSGLVSAMWSRLGFLSADEKRRLEEDKRVSMLKEGAIFTRRVAGKPPSPVWLQLTVEADETAARIEWRSPQLVLNRAVNKDGLALDACRHVRASNESDAEFFSASPGARELDLCLTLLTDKTRAVFEATSKEERDAWIQGIEAAMTRHASERKQKGFEESAAEGERQDAGEEERVIR